jgi:hypothetical protein
VAIYHQNVIHRLLAFVCDKGDNAWRLLAAGRLPGRRGQDPGRVAQSPAEARDLRKSGREVRVLVDVWALRDVEPPVGLAVRLRALGAEARVCAPPDCAEQLAEM